MLTPETCCTITVALSTCCAALRAGPDSARSIQEQKIRPMQSHKLHAADFIVLAVLLCVLLPVTNILYSTDSMTYILKAERIAVAFEYDDFTRGPMMPAIGALFISLFGKSAIVLSMSVRVFFFLSVIGFGALAWR